MRANSQTYGKWYGVILSSENKKQFLIPEGFAHGFLILSDETEFYYKVNDFGHPNDEDGMHGMTRRVVLSGRNQRVSIKAAQVRRDTCWKMVPR